MRIHLHLTGRLTVFKFKYLTVPSLTITFLATGLLAPAIAIAQPKPWFQETIDIKLGAVFMFHDTDFEVTEPGGRKVSVDFENDLNVDEFAVSPNVEFRWRFTKNKKHRLMVSYFGIFRDGTANIDFVLDLGGGVVIPVSTETKTEFDFNIVDVSYGYSLLLDEKKELGLFAGLDFIFVNFRFKAAVAGVDKRGKIADNFKFPFPTVGAYFDYAFTERLALQSKFQVFGLSIGDISGAIFRGDLRLQHNTFEHVGFYAGYELLGMTGSVDLDSLSELTNFSHGPTVGLALRF